MTEFFERHEHDDSCEPLYVQHSSVTYMPDGPINEFGIFAERPIGLEVARERVAEALGVDPSRIMPHSSGRSRGGKKHGVTDWTHCKWEPTGPPSKADPRDN